MAIIKCTECGKSFSDKAACCPECGCPTEIVLKEGSAPTAIAKKQQSGQEATKAILDEVKRTRDKAKSAERLFDSRNQSIQMKASRTIDLFGGYATSTVVEIQADVRRACDDLYTSYQTLVELLDGFCRPLLDAAPSGEAIKAVADLIKFLNEESEIESNFTASFNGTSLGNVANSKYVPSISNKMIQKFWENQYASSPYAAECEKKRRMEAEAARKRREEERKRRAEEEKRREEERRAAQKRKEGETAKAKAVMDKVVAEAKQRIADFRQKLNEEEERQIKALQGQIAQAVERFTKQIADYTAQRQSLGAFRFGEKKKLAQEIALAQERIARLSEPRVMDREREKMKKLVAQAVEAYTDEINQYLSGRFPYSSHGNRAGEMKSWMNEYSEDSAYARRAIPRMPDVSAVFEQNKR